MAKQYSSNSNNKLGFVYDFSIAKPFDTRDVVEKVGDLLEIDYAYVGMLVAVTSTKSLYQCVNVTTPESATSHARASTTSDWKQVGGSGSGSSSLTPKALSELAKNDNLFEVASTETKYYTADQYDIYVADGGEDNEEDFKKNIEDDPEYYSYTINTYKTVIKASALPSYVDDVIDVTMSSYDSSADLKESDPLATFVEATTKSGTTTYKYVQELYVTDSKGNTTNVYEYDFTDHKVTTEAEAGKIYIDDDNNQYRWTGSKLVIINRGDIETRVSGNETNIAKLTSELTWKEITSE